MHDCCSARMRPVTCTASPSLQRSQLIVYIPRRFHITCIFSFHDDVFTHPPVCKALNGSCRRGIGRLASSHLSCQPHEVTPNTPDTSRVPGPLAVPLHSPSSDRHASGSCTRGHCILRRPWQNSIHTTSRQHTRPTRASATAPLRTGVGAQHGGRNTYPPVPPGVGAYVSSASAPPGRLIHIHLTLLYLHIKGTVTSPGHDARACLVQHRSAALEQD